MLSEIQGAARPPLVPQLRAAVPAPASSPELAAPVPAASSPVAPSAELRQEVSRPKVQPLKPIEVKVDMEKMRANLQESLEKLNAALRDGDRIGRAQGEAAALIATIGTGAREQRRVG